MFHYMCTLNFNTHQSQFLCKHILDFFFAVIPRLPLCLFYSMNYYPIICSLYYFGEICLLNYSGHTLALFSIHKFLEYPCLTFSFFATLSTFSSELFCVNSRLFLRKLISFCNPCISYIVSLKVPLT